MNIFLCKRRTFASLKYVRKIKCKGLFTLCVKSWAYERNFSSFMDFQAFVIVVFLSHLPNTKIIVVLQTVIIENQEHAITF